jgi:putative NIF3 family GTP cyclohydrolase 1 type 2
MPVLRSDRRPEFISVDADLLNRTARFRRHPQESACLGEPHISGISPVDPVEVLGLPRSDITRLAVVGGIGDQMDAAERLGAHAYLTGELHVRIEGDHGRRKFAEVRRFAATTTMTLIGVSHAGSEHLVIETQLTRRLDRTFGLPLHPIREPRWWR